MEAFPPMLGVDEFAVVNPDFWSGTPEEQQGFQGWYRFSNVSYSLLLFLLLLIIWSFNFQWIECIQNLLELSRGQGKGLDETWKRDGRVKGFDETEKCDGRVKGLSSGVK